MAEGKSFRSKLEDFFNPGPAAAGKQSGKRTDLEDPVDIYSHTGKFFKANKVTDSYAETIEVGERKIRGGIEELELDQAIYGGKKVSRKELEQQSEDEEDEDFDDDEEIEDSSNDLPVDMELSEEASSEPPKAGDDEEEEELEQALKQLKAEEQDDSQFNAARVSSEVEKGKSVRIQKKVFDQFLHQRILMQKLLLGANRLPHGPVLAAYTATGLGSCRRELKSYIKDVTRAQRDLFKLSETPVAIQEFDDEEESTVDTMYKTLDHNFQQVLPFVEETVERWNSRT